MLGEPNGFGSFSPAMARLPELIGPHKLSLNALRRTFAALAQLSVLESTASAVTTIRLCSINPRNKPCNSCISISLVISNSISLHLSSSDFLRDSLLLIQMLKPYFLTFCDTTVFVILKLKNGKYSLVNIYRKRQQTSDYHIYQIGQLINKYNPQKVGVEVTGGTKQVYLEQLSKQHKDISFEAVRTTGDSKPIMITNLVLALEKEVIEYPSNSPLIEEMLSFRRQGNKLEAAPGKYDDCIMSTCFALSVTPLTNKSSNSTFYNTSIGVF